MKFSKPVLVWLGAVVLTGCAGPAAVPEASSVPVSVAPSSDAALVGPSPSVLPAVGDYWFLSSNGAVGKFSLPGEPVAEVEELRKIVDADPVTYLQVVVDNRGGFEPVNMYELNAFGEDGTKYTFKRYGDALEAWHPSLDGPGGTMLYNRFVAAINGDLEGADVGEVKEFTMTTDTTDLPESFTRISVKAHGDMDEVEAFPASDSQGMDLTFEAPKK